MGYGASAGWILGVALAGATSVLACGGNAESSGGDGDSSDDSFGGSSGSASGGASNGGASQGGSAPTGGVSQGGTISVGGAGTGGAPSCDCPEASYALVVQGDGPTLTMPYNGVIDPSADRAPLPCAEEPLRGAVGGCVRSISVSACQAALNGPPCLEIAGVAVRYVSRTGDLYTGRVTSDVPETSIPGVEAGTLTVELANASGEALTLTVIYSFCAPFGNLRIVC